MLSATVAMLMSLVGLAVVLMFALRRRSESAPRPPVDATEWTQTVADARITRQLETGDAIDAKGGVLFAYGGVLLVAAPTLTSQYTWQMGATLVFALLTIVATTAIALWPQNYNDPPDARKLANSLRDGYSTRAVLESLTAQQLDAIDTNERLLKLKARAVRLAVGAAVLGTVTLAWEVAAANGVI
jgi:hypothetical protein